MHSVRPLQFRGRCHFCCLFCIAFRLCRATAALSARFGLFSGVEPGQSPGADVALALAQMLDVDHLPLACAAFCVLSGLWRQRGRVDSDGGYSSGVEAVLPTVAAAVDAALCRPDFIAAAAAMDPAALPRFLYHALLVCRSMEAHRNASAQAMGCLRHHIAAAVQQDIRCAHARRAARFLLVASITSPSGGGSSSTQSELVGAAVQLAAVLNVVQDKAPAGEKAAVKLASSLQLAMTAAMQLARSQVTPPSYSAHKQQNWSNSCSGMQCVRQCLCTSLNVSFWLLPAGWQAGGHDCCNGFSAMGRGRRLCQAAEDCPVAVPRLRACPVTGDATAARAFILPETRCALVVCQSQSWRAVSNAFSGCLMCVQELLQAAAAALPDSAQRRSDICAAAAKFSAETAAGRAQPAAATLMLAAVSVMSAVPAALAAAGMAAAALQQSRRCRVHSS